MKGIGIGKKTAAVLKGLKLDHVIYDKPRKSSVEAYERDFDAQEFKDSLANTTEKEVLLVLYSSDPISTVVLTMLRCLCRDMGKTVDVLLLMDDVKGISKKGKQIHRMIYGVLQNKAGRGFRELILFDLRVVDSIVSPKASITTYESLFAGFIASAVGWYYYSKTQEPLLENLTEGNDVANIVALGQMGFEGFEQNYFDLKYIRSKDYYFFLNQTDLEKKGMMSEIKELIPENEQECSFGFAIFNNGSGESFVQTVSISSYTYNGSDDL